MPPRSEQVFVDGKRCSHVPNGTAPGAMPDYSFTATLSDPARYVLKFPKGLHPDTALTEITVKSSLLNVRANNLRVDGFRFRRGRNTYQSALVILHGEAIEFRNCIFEDSSAGSGMNIQASHCRIHDNIFRANGQFGFALSGTGNVLEDNLVTGNDRAGYKEWGTGGTKIVGSGCIVRRNRFIENLGGVAIWLDSGPCNNVIERNYVSGNYGEGIRAEISFHNYIGYNIVENTRECTSTMFGRTQTHNIGISMQNSAETVVCNNFLRNNRGVGIEVFTYRRKGADLPEWQLHHPDEKHRQWLRRSWDGGLVYANDNLVSHNVVVQTIEEAGDACIWLRGILNGDSPHCYGNQIDSNFYWNSVTQSPRVRIKDLSEVPDGTSQWQTRYGMDVHARGGFSPADYRRPAFTEDYPYAPTAALTGIGQDSAVNGFPGHVAIDYLGNPLAERDSIGIGHIQFLRK
jgi:parallel beta-helix repeat protein